MKTIDKEGEIKMDEQKQIEEMAKMLSEDCGNCYICDFCDLSNNDVDCIKYYNANKIYNAGYRKIPEGAVVLTEGEYSDILEDDIQTFERDVAEYWACDNPKDVAEELYKDGYRKLDNHAIMVLRKAKGLENRIKKETAREIIDRIKKLSQERHEETLFDYYTTYEIGSGALDKIAKQYGVEVEE